MGKTRANSAKFPTDVVSVSDLTKENILQVLKKAAEMEKLTDKKRVKILENKVVGLLFFEPSTRTKLSFQLAVEKLGAKSIGFDSVDSTSIKKGESFPDTIKIVSNYVDAIVIRHSVNGCAAEAARISDKPVINAGDGYNEHPSQALTDLYTIKKEFGKLENLTIGFLGDLRYGRTVHSLAPALAMFNTKKMYFVSPPMLKMDGMVVEDLRETTEVVELEKLNDCLLELDILYVTRIQAERFRYPSAYEQVRGSYTIDKEILQKAKKGLRIMHPLPRVDEIKPELDSCKEAIYFKQAANGVPVREALLSLLLRNGK